MKIKAAGEMIHIEGGGVRHTYRRSDVRKVASHEKRQCCSIAIGQDTFEFTPEELGVKTLKRAEKRLQGFMKRPVFRWY